MVCRILGAARRRLESTDTITLDVVAGWDGSTID